MSVDGSDTAGAPLSILARSASKVAAALAIEAFIAPANLANRTSRDSRLASSISSAGVTDLPS